MNIQLRDLVQAEEVLGRMFQARPAQAKTTFRIAQLKRGVSSAFGDFYPARVQLLEKYATLTEEAGRYEFVKKDEDGEVLLDEEGNTQRDHESIEAFKISLEELLDEEVEIPVKPLTLPIIDSIGLDPALSVEEMETIFWLIRDGS